MTNLNVNEGILAAYPWLKEILAATGSRRTRILMVADGAVNFGHNFFGLSRLVEALRQSSSPGTEVVVNTAHRSERAEGREAEDYLFKFQKGTLLSSSGVKVYEQVWLFGYLDTAADVLPDAELKVLAEFMNSGGGVFATGDHAALGFSLCGNVPRVRAMRKWREGTPPRNDPTRHSTVLEGRDPGYQASDESDDIPQTIIPRLYQTGCEVNPHPLLTFGNTPITVLPDHMHEGECVEPTEEQLQGTYGTDPEFAEFPLMPGSDTRPSPDVIALSVSAGGRIKEKPKDFHPPVIPRGFGAICAYDGNNVVGRVVVDASFHHFTDANLDGAGASFGTGFFDADGKPTKHYAAITQYFRNIAAYLNPPDFRLRSNINLLVLLRYMYPLIEELRRDEAATMENILEVGELTRRAISSYLSPAEAAEYALSLLDSLEGFDALQSFVNPRLAAKADMQGPNKLLNVHTLTNAILGVALLCVTEQLPPKTDQVAEKLLEIESREGGLVAIVQNDVGRLANVWQPLVEQSHRMLSEFARSYGGKEE
jgi:hypothetical protein